MAICLIALMGCLSASAAESGSPAGPATSTPAAQGSYRDLLTPEARKALVDAEAVRALDPCGFLDYRVFDQVGAPAYIGAGREVATELGLNSCDMLFGSAAAGQLSVTVQGRYRGDTSLPGTPLQVGDTTGMVEPWKPYGGCDIRIQLDILDIDYFELGSMWPEKDSCASLSAIVEASARLIHTRPLRENSPYPGMKTKLGHVDPCGVLDSLLKTYPLGPGGIFDIHPGCTFHYQRSTDHYPKTVTITFGIDEPKRVDVPHSQPDDFRSADPIDSVPIATQTWNGGIVTVLELGYSTPIPVKVAADEAATEFDTAAVQCSGQGCADLVHAITVALVELYHRTP
ncbi:hypothetical protein ACFXHA_16375 [Nocardia sp. NPDC059240]|uniref:hypothetical protein n=1 Tax=Nocardia sp. NPDC059240 TaxID=3346786 RepID=UPI0036B61DFD